MHIDILFLYLSHLFLLIPSSIPLHVPLTLFHILPPLASSPSFF